MKYLNSLLFMSIAIVLLSCGSTYSVIEDEEGAIIVGQLTWEQWQDHAGWDSYFPRDYTPLKRDVEDIGHYSNYYDISYIIFAGSWCHDTEVGLPKIYKLLTMAGVFPQNIKLIGLDLGKQEPTGLADEFEIEKVPTLVVMDGMEELGRIVETPKKSWDKDLLKILRDFVFEQGEQSGGGTSEE